ncbi:MAG TPA: TonB family protein [Polyangiaceae bacterium]|nr:TonB family protein [Polyangiaceae bacterium]
MTPAAAVVALPDALQLCALYRRSLVLLVSAREAEGHVVVEGGEIVHAFWGDLTGEDAVYAMLACGDAHFQSVSVSDVYSCSPVRTIQATAQQLLLEGARRQDEGSLLRPARRSHLEASPSSTLAPFSVSRTHTSRTWSIRALGAALLALVSLAALSNRAPNTAVAVDGSVSARVSGEPLDVSALAPTDGRPKLLAGKSPARPASQLALSPTIVLRLLIERDGRVKQAKVYRSRRDLAAFEKAALEAARHYHFSPAVRGAEPVAVWMNWPVVFTSRDAARATLQIKGSDTIGGALGPELAQVFREETGADVKFEALGSATAFGGLFDGTALIGASSRSVNAEELAEARALGIELQEYVIGYDGVAVITHPSNPIRALSMQQVAALFSGEIADWSEIRGGQLRRVSVLRRPAYSGTHEFFRSRVLSRPDEPVRDFSPRGRVLEKSEQLVLAVSEDPGAIGYVGLGHLKPGVQALAVAENERARPVAPSASSVRDGTYPVYRPLLMYTNGAPSSASAAFLRFVLSERGQSIVEKHGFIANDVEGSGPLPEDELAAGAGASNKVHRVLFQNRSARLDAQAVGMLDDVAVELRRGRCRALIVGNADFQGKSRVNAKLAEQRAELVAAYLRDAGVTPDLLQVEALSDARPLASNATRAGRDLNRRVDVYLVSR